MKAYMKVVWIVVIALSLISCGNNNQVNEMIENNQSVENKVEATVVESKEETVEDSSNNEFLKCGQVYQSDHLSYNILDVVIEDDVLKLNMEVYNHSNEEINFTPMDRLTIFDDKNQECGWNMMIGKLNGSIAPDNKIMGVVGFDLEDENVKNFVLHIGASFEYEPAIAITSEDLGQSFAEAFENSGIKSEYGIGSTVMSDQFDMTVLGATTIPSDKEGKDILLINMSIKNNDKEARGLGLEIDGVYSADGEALTTEVNEWTFTNWPIDPGATEEGIVSFYCSTGQEDFYMTVKPNIRDYSHSEKIVFSALKAEATTGASEGAGGSDLISSMGFDRPQTMKIVSEIKAFGNTTVMSTYYDGDKSRTEVDMPGMAKSIMIHIPNREVMYQYVYGESTGVKITGADVSSAQEMGMMVDTSMLAAITDGSSRDVSAKVDYLDGEEVIYIEATQSDEDMGDVLVKMWYSERYASPLKYEIYVEGSLLIELNVTQVSDNINFQGDLFMPPEDITFEEIDMETLMKNW